MVAPKVSSVNHRVPVFLSGDLVQLAAVPCVDVEGNDVALMQLPANAVPMGQS